MPTPTVKHSVSYHQTNRSWLWGKIWILNGVSDGMFFSHRSFMLLCSKWRLLWNFLLVLTFSYVSSTHNDFPKQFEFETSFSSKKFPQFRTLRTGSYRLCPFQHVSTSFKTLLTSLFWLKFTLAVNCGVLRAIARFSRRMGCLFKKV